MNFSIKKPILLISIFLLLLIPFVNASFPYDLTNKTGNETFDNGTVMLINWTQDFVVNGSVHKDVASAQIGSVYVHLLANVTDGGARCEFFKMRINDCGSVGHSILGYSNSDNTSLTMSIGNTGCFGDICLRDDRLGGIDIIENVAEDGTFHDWKLCVGSDGNFNVSINGTLKASRTYFEPFGTPIIFGWGRGVEVGDTCNFDADNWVSVNQSVYPFLFITQPITARVTLPLESTVEIGAMIVLFLIILGSLVGFGFKNKK